MSYRVKLNVFEGPFDLLVYLIEHAQMNIYDINITDITRQYLDYIDDMKNADIAVSSEFMVLASALLEIKSRMLLPRPTSGDGEESMMEDPRTELVSKLLEYKKFKAVSQMLSERFDDCSRMLEKPQEDLALYTGEPDEYLDLDIDRFRAAFEQFLARKKKLDDIKAHHRRSEKQRMTTEMRMENIRSFFVDNGFREADFRELIMKRDDKYDVAVTFSSVLEMMKNQKLDADQKYIFGDITVTAKGALFANETREETEDTWQVQKQ